MGGLALIIGSALYIASTLILSVIVHTNGEVNDLNALVDSISDNPSLTWFSTVLGGVGLMFMLWGLLVMWQTAQSKCALDTFVKFGIFGLMFALVSFFWSRRPHLHDISRSWSWYRRKVPMPIRCGLSLCICNPSLVLRA